MPVIPNELLTECPEIKKIPDSTPDAITEWIVTEVNDHGKCIIKSKLTVEYMLLLQEYNLKSQDNEDAN